MANWVLSGTSSKFKGIMKERVIGIRVNRSNEKIINEKENKTRR